VRRGLAASRAAAAEMIGAGQVLVGGATADKAARLVAPDEPVTVRGAGRRWVSRGGDKLEAALEHFGIDADGLDVLDAGSSTGGFTDCLLSRGAETVTAVDVGRAQLHERLRADPRVRVMERTDIRAVAADPPPPGLFPLVVADLSFISLRTVAPALTSLTRPGGDMVVLIKPQFEAGRAEVSRGGGVVRDPDVRRAALVAALSALQRCGAAIMGVMESPLRGADGNVEYLAHLRPETEGGITPEHAGAAF
jgi:23S rRNA (cytidine1920-2'-O)/16S rRNA (cytidine1409-2'-O)-methyltransferase